jgi:hypothetical protein
VKHGGSVRFEPLEGADKPTSSVTIRRPRRETSRWVVATVAGAISLGAMLWWAGAQSLDDRRATPVSGSVSAAVVKCELGPTGLPDDRWASCADSSANTASAAVANCEFGPTAVPDDRWASCAAVLAGPSAAK